MGRTIMPRNLRLFLVRLSLSVFFTGRIHGLDFPSHREGLNDPCTATSGEEGVCRPISECPSALATLRTAPPTHCGWKGQEPLICCLGPQLATVDNCAPANPLTRKKRQRPRLPFLITPRTTSSSSSSTSLPSSEAFEATTTATVKPHIIGGVLSLLDSRPWMVAICSKTDDPEISAFDRLKCGGTLVGTHHIVTAAHCFGESRDPDRYEVYLGTNVLNVTHRDSLSLSKVTVHPKFDSTALYFDIALLRLRHGVAFRSGLRPACLPTGSLGRTRFAGTQGLVTGWGTIDYLSKRSLALREVELALVGNGPCNNTLWEIPQMRRVYPAGIASSLICAGGDEEERKDACQGDSGGPLTWNAGTTNRWVLIGIVSSGFRCGVPGVPGVYTRITSFMDWIVENAT